ncbi:hypothetical protein L916_10636, partial [Phytophthora nicotianae]
MLNPIEGVLELVERKMRRFMAEQKQEFQVSGEYATFTEQRLALMKEAVAMSKGVITHRL